MHAIRLSVYAFLFSAYRKPNFLVYGKTIVSTVDETQQGNPEAPPFFAQTIQTLVNDMQSIFFNECHLDDGNLADDFKIVADFELRKRSWFVSKFCKI